MQVADRRLIGGKAGVICASCVSRSPLRKLQGEQAATTFSQVVAPPFDRGVTWSKVSSSREPQYWQTNRSRRNTLKRVKAGERDGFT